MSIDSHRCFIGASWPIFVRHFVHDELGRIAFTSHRSLCHFTVPCAESSESSNHLYVFLSDMPLCWWVHNFVVVSIILFLLPGHLRVSLTIYHLISPFLSPLVWTVEHRWIEEQVIAFYRCLFSRKSIESRQFIDMLTGVWHLEHSNPEKKRASKRLRLCWAEILWFNSQQQLRALWRNAI